MIPHRPTTNSIRRIELVVGQFVIIQKFIPHCLRSDVGLLFDLANRSPIRSCNSGCRRTNRLNARLNDDAKTTVITCVTHPLFE